MVTGNYGNLNLNIIKIIIHKKIATLLNNDFKNISIRLQLKSQSKLTIRESIIATKLKV